MSEQDAAIEAARQAYANEAGRTFAGIGTDPLRAAIAAFLDNVVVSPEMASALGKAHFKRVCEAVRDGEQNMLASEPDTLAGRAMLATLRREIA